MATLFATSQNKVDITLVENVESKRSELNDLGSTKGETTFVGYNEALQSRT